MAFELMNLVSPFNYSNNVLHLNKSDILDQPAFDKLELSAKYWYSKKNSQQLFEIFGCFNNEEPEDVRSDICNRIKIEMKFYGKVGTVHLLFISNDIEKWLKMMKNNRNYGDPLMLYALSRTFQRHSVVLCANRAWSTVGTDDPIDSDRLLEICNVKLVYIGYNMFGELCEKTVPSIPPMLSNHDINGATSASVSGINQPGYNINVGLEQSPNTVLDDDVPPVDTLDYIDSSDFSDLDGSLEDTIIYPLLDNTVNTLKTPLLNVDDTTDRPIGTGYYTKVNDNSDANIEGTPRSDIGLSADAEIDSLNKNTMNQENKPNDTIETSVSVLGSNDDVPRNDRLQGINSSQNVSVSSINTENVSESVLGSNKDVPGNDGVQGINSSQNTSVSGINTNNIAEDHNYAAKSTNTVNVNSINNVCEPESVDVIGLNGTNSVQSVPGTEGIDTINEHPDSNELIEPEDCDSNTSGNSSTDMVSKLRNLFLVKNPETAFYKIWEKDASKKRLSVKIITRKPGGFMQSCVFPCIVKFLVHLLQYLKDTINIIPQTTTKYVVLYENWVTQI